MRVVRQSKAALSKAQQQFNKLLSEVQRLRNRLTLWQDFDVRQKQRFVAELMPRMNQINRHRGEWILLCHEILEGRCDEPIAQKVERKRLLSLVQVLLRTYLESEDNHAADVIAVHDFYSGVSYARIFEEEVRDFRYDARAMFGVDIPEDIASEDLDAYLASELARREDAGELGGAGTKRSKSSRGQNPQGSASLFDDSPPDKFQDAKQSLRDVYRKLVGVLHPDRGTDDADRERRHGLMLRANAAYESADLFALLRLQVEINPDATGNATLSASHLKLYSQMLRKQLDVLKGEVDAITHKYREATMDSRSALTPESVERHFSQTVEEVKQEQLALDDVIDGFQSVAWRKAWLRDWDDGLIDNVWFNYGRSPEENFEEDLMEEALATFWEAERNKAAQAGRGKKAGSDRRGKKAR